MNAYLKKTVITFGSAVVIVSSTSLILRGPGSYDANIQLYQSIFKWALFVVAITLVLRETIFNLKYLNKNQVFWFAVCTLLVVLSFTQLSGEIRQNQLEVSKIDQYLYIIRCMGIGFFEETFFRVLIFGYICRISGQSASQSPYKATIITSMLFALIHFMNLLNPQVDLISAINQVMLAFLLGILLQCLLFRFNNLLLVAVLHGIIDFFGMKRNWLYPDHSASASGNDINSILSTAIAAVIFGALIVLPAFYFTFRKEPNRMILFED